MCTSPLARRLERVVELARQRTLSCLERGKTAGRLGGSALPVSVDRRCVEASCRLFSDPHWQRTHARAHMCTSRACFAATGTRWSRHERRRSKRRADETELKEWHLKRGPRAHTLHTKHTGAERGSDLEHRSSEQHARRVDDCTRRSSGRRRRCRPTSCCCRSCCVNLTTHQGLMIRL